MNTIDSNSNGGSIVPSKVNVYGRDADNTSATHGPSLECDDGGGGGKGTVGGRERLSSSHYSTEKSGSSGYYSSNVYSSSSVEDHIYSEPVIDVIDTESTPKTNKRLRRKIEQKLDHQIGLANLEKSVKSLEKHLKLLSRSQQQQPQQPQSQSPCELCGSSAAETSGDEKVKRLPTIVEGIDTNACVSVAGKAKSVRRITHGHGGVHGWPTDTDDSLMDLDLDSFRTANEKRDKTATKAGGIENPTFVPDDEDDEDDDDDAGHIPVTCSDKEHIENNYKCTKYINSCPDDAYNVEGVNDYKYAAPSATMSCADDKTTMSFFAKNCDDQVHCQNTKAILEEIHVKLSQLLIQPTDAQPRRTTSDSSDSDISRIASDASGDTDSLKTNIQTLQRDLGNYLKLMNEQNEMEIRQFCSGLSKNYKLLTMQHALANKSRTRSNRVALDQSGSDAYSNRSYCSSSSCFADYGLAPQSDILYVRNAFNYDDSHQTSRKSMLDGNFQLQRRHSDSVYSSWDEERHIIASGSSGDETSARSEDVVVLDTVVVVPAEKMSNAEAINAPNAPSHIESNLAMQQPPALIAVGDKSAPSSDEKDLMLEWHRNKPSIWQQYYGSKRLKYSNVVKKIKGKLEINPAMAYVSAPLFQFNSNIPKRHDLQADGIIKRFPHTRMSYRRRSHTI